MCRRSFGPLRTAYQVRKRRRAAARRCARPYRAHACKVERVERHLRGRLADRLRRQQADGLARVGERVPKSQPHQRPELGGRQRPLVCTGARQGRAQRAGSGGEVSLCALAADAIGSGRGRRHTSFSGKLRLLGWSPDTRPPGPSLASINCHGQITLRPASKGRAW